MGLCATTFRLCTVGFRQHNWTCAREICCVVNAMLSRGRKQNKYVYMMTNRNTAFCWKIMGRRIKNFLSPYSANTGYVYTHTSIKMLLTLCVRRSQLPANRLLLLICVTSSIWINLSWRICIVKSLCEHSMPFDLPARPLSPFPSLQLFFLFNKRLQPSASRFVYYSWACYRRRLVYQRILQLW